jgi:hypothetical protein
LERGPPGSLLEQDPAMAIAHDDALASLGDLASADKRYQPKHAGALSLMVESVLADNSKINRLTTSLSRGLLWRRYCRVSSGFGHHLKGPEMTVRIRERKL